MTSIFKTLLGQESLVRGVGSRRIPSLVSRFAAFNVVVWAFSIGGIPLMAQQAPADSEGRIDVMAAVNGSRITRSQLAEECMMRFGEEVLQGMVNRQLIINEARQYQIQINEQEIADEIERVASKWGLATDRWLAMLKEKRNITPEKYREFIWTTLMLRRLAAQEIVITAEEVDALLESEIGPKVQVRLIAANTIEEAQQLHAMVVQNPDSFGKVAREHSADQNSAANSGIIPPIRKNSGDSAFETVAFSLQQGQISDVLTINDQHLILRCEQIIPAQPITPQQEQIARKSIIDHLNDKKLAEAADRIFLSLQEKTVIKNAYNDPNLQQQYPGVAALVGNAQIAVTDLAEECIARHGVDVLEGEINRVLLLQEINRRGIEIQDHEIQDEIVRAADSFGYVNAEGEVEVDKWLEHVTAEDGVTVDLYVRDAVWPSVALKNLVEDGVEVTAEDIEKAFAANFGERVEALAIVLQDQRTANKVWNLAMKNKTPQFFGELAHTYSTEPASQANYGRVPPIEMYGGRKKLEDEAFALSPGDVSGLINIGEHWIILMCLGRTEPRVTDPNDPAIRQELQDDIFEKKLRLAMAQKFASVRESASIDNFLLGTTQSPPSQRAAQVPTQGGRVPFGQVKRQPNP